MAIAENWLEKRQVDSRMIVYWNGVEARLAGTYPHTDVLPDIEKLDGVSGDAARPLEVDFGPPFDLLNQYRNNFFRHWVIFYANFVDGKWDPIKKIFANINPDCSEIKPSVTSAGVSWRQRYSPFMYNQAAGKWDLWRYNEAYFTKLRIMLKQAQDHNLIVQLTLFDRSGIAATGPDQCLRWHYSPWNSANNVNKVIRNNVNGVADFYNRNLQGEIQNAAGVTEKRTLGQIQDAYLAKVMQSTVDFPNVCYEIMNEPEGGPIDLQGIPLRVRWANEIVGVIHSFTQGKRFIFYNDMTGFTAGDLVKWASLSNSNYDKLDGVIFHGDIQNYNPDDSQHPLNAAVRRDKIIQVSSDTHTDPSHDYNLSAAKNAFTHHMIFQSETNADTANRGIRDAMLTFARLPQFVGRWWKIPGQSTPPDFFPHVAHVINADATVVDLNQDTDQFTMLGRIVGIWPDKLSSWNNLGDPSRQPLTFNYEFTERLQPPLTFLQFVRENTVQVFRKLDQRDLHYPFYFKWERISVIPVTSPIPPFHLFFYPDNTLVAHPPDPKNYQVVYNKGTVSEITATQITILSSTMNNKKTTWNYFFRKNNQELTLEKVLTAEDNQPLTQIFHRLL